MYDCLTKLDLNLLVAFQVLLEERNTVRAAKRLYLSQSAVSKILAKLRTTFDDDLFVRSANGLAPTPKALELEQPLHEVLGIINTITGSGSFDPATASGDIYLGIPEPLALLVVPPLIELQKELAPQLNFHSHNVIEDYRYLLHNDMLDFCLYQYEHEKGLISNKVGHAELVCLMRKNHPLADEICLSEETILSSDRIIYTIPLTNSSGLNTFISQSRNCSDQHLCLMETSQLLLAVDQLLRTDAIMLCLPGLKDIAPYKDYLIEKSVEEDSFITNQIDIYLTQHQRTTNSPLHTWISKQIETVVQRVFPATTEPNRSN